MFTKNTAPFLRAEAVSAISVQGRKEGVRKGRCPAEEVSRDGYGVVEVF